MSEYTPFYTELEKAMHKNFKLMSDVELKKEWKNSQDQVEKWRQNLQAIDSEREEYMSRRANIVIKRVFGRIELDAVTDDIQVRFDVVAENFKAWVITEHGCRNEAIGRGMK
jgi:seryl-tRNA synthetase